MSKKFNLTPKSNHARRFGNRVRNVIIDTEEKDRMFVRFEGWNRWVWVQKRNDPHYVVKRGWVPEGAPLKTCKKDDFKGSVVKRS